MVKAQKRLGVGQTLFEVVSLHGYRYRSQVRHVLYGVQGFRKQWVWAVNALRTNPVCQSRKRVHAFLGLRFLNVKREDAQISLLELRATVV